MTSLLRTPVTKTSINKRAAYTPTLSRRIFSKTFDVGLAVVIYAKVHSSTWPNDFASKVLEIGGLFVDATNFGIPK